MCFKVICREIKFKFAKPINRCFLGPTGLYELGAVFHTAQCDPASNKCFVFFKTTICYQCAPCHVFEVINY